VLQNGTTRFRLFAPSCVAVSLETADFAPLSMKKRSDGFFEIAAPAPPGTRYRYRVGDRTVPDPASRLQANGVHGWSVVADPNSYVWTTEAWSGRPWEETVIYELHPGLCGGFWGIAARLEELRDLGFTAIELMPVAATPGARNWGYDGVLHFAPQEAYGAPNELKALIDRAHGLGLMVFLDVVYNHFGPDGNYLSVTAPEFFRNDLVTPWGTAIDFRREIVRRFFIENALYWIGEFRFDGLRFDAVHAIAPSGWLLDLAREVRAVAAGRAVHLMLENDNNDPALLRDGFTAQWNDDFHHALHVLLTGEEHGYYADHAGAPAVRLARVLRDGFDYQGQHSTHRAGPRGARSGDLSPTSFIAFLQNHDQTGNRATGERLTVLADEHALKAAIALLLLAPQIPLVFMGEEVGSHAPFLYFTDHNEDLARAVRAGRAREFAFAAGALPDPNAQATFKASLPSGDAPLAAEWQAFFQQLLRLRFEKIVPRLRNAAALDATALASSVVLARWRMADGARLTIGTNLGDESPVAELPATLPFWGWSEGGRVLPRSTVAWLEAA
jgi:malto-oligosyltrehalose trehalohydrolase